MDSSDQIQTLSVKKKYRIFHINGDLKFLFLIENYSDEYFDNLQIIIGDKSTIVPHSNHQTHFFPMRNSSIKNIVDLCKDSDLVVLNSLNYFNSKLALALPSWIKIAWRFFGYELYSRDIESVLSKNTLIIRNLETLKVNPLSIFKKIHSLLIQDPIFRKSIGRINYFLGVIPEEYDFLKTQWKNLPLFIKYPLNNNHHNFNLTKKEPYYILGNNKSIYNNHIDIIDKIKSAPNYFNYSGKVLFNYGSDNFYTNYIKNIVNNCSSLEIVETYLDRTNFINLYNRASALVLNGYRQMALDNISTAIQNGVKIYLHKRNITFTWLKKEGFLVYTIDNFITDYTEGNLCLTKNEAEYNYDLYSKMNNNYNNDNFSKKLITVITNEV